MQIEFQYYLKVYPLAQKWLLTMSKNISLLKYHYLQIQNSKLKSTKLLKIVNRNNSYGIQQIKSIQNYKELMKLVHQLHESNDYHVKINEQLLFQQLLYYQIFLFFLFFTIIYKLWIFSNYFFLSEYHQQYIFRYIYIYVCKNLMSQCQFVKYNNQKIAPIMRTTNQTHENNNNQLRQGQQQGVEQNAENKTQQQKKEQKKRKPLISLKPQLFEKEKGLKKLYQLTNSINWQDSMTTQSAMNLVILTLKSWQNSFLHKYYHQLFFQRCQALGTNKLVSAYMNKVRRIHKGLDKWDQQKIQNNNPNLQHNQNPTDNKSVHNTNKNKNNKNSSDNQGQALNIQNDHQVGYQNYDDDIDEYQKFKQRAELAKKLGNINVQNNNENKNKNKTQQQKQIDDIMDQDLRLFQQMISKKNNKNNNNNDKKNNQQNLDDGIDLGGESGVQFDDGDFDYD